MGAQYEPSLDDLVAMFDGELERFLEQKRASLVEAQPMTNEIARLLGAGGKRLRPLFCYWGYRAGGGSHGPEIVAAASGLELLHTFAIVHDDIIDRSKERRGLPTTYALLGTDIALLVGDFALVLADAALMESGFDASLLNEAFEAYSRMRQEVIAGQYLDVVAAARSGVSVDEARRIAVLKSGRYSIQEPLVIGARLAGAPEEVVKGLSDLGTPLGEAFQLRDDLLGIFGDPEQTGKPVDDDIRQGKRHVLYAHALELLKGEQHARFAELWGGGDRLSEAAVNEVRDILIAGGARAATEDLVDDLKAQTHEILAAMDVDEGSRAALADLSRRAIDRAI
jgi:geranylgeranyl diphosphate synthase type I